MGPALALLVAMLLVAAPAHGRRLQDPVRHLDGRSLCRRGRRSAAQAGVGATYGNLRYAIRHKVDKPPALNGKDAYDGRLNAEKALAAIHSIVEGD